MAAVYASAFEAFEAAGHLRWLNVKTSRDLNDIILSSRVYASDIPCALDYFHQSRLYQARLSFNTDVLTCDSECVITASIYNSFGRLIDTKKITFYLDGRNYNHIRHFIRDIIKIFEKNMYLALKRRALRYRKKNRDWYYKTKQF